MLATLVELRADLEAVAPSGATVPCFVRTAEAVPRRPQNTLKTMSFQRKESISFEVLM